MTKRQQRKELRKECKKNARGVIKRHYILFVFLIVMAGFLGTKESLATTIFSSGDDQRGTVFAIERNSDFNNVLVDLMKGDVEEGTVRSDTHLANAREEESKRIGGLEFGHKDGVFSTILDSITSGSILLTIFSSIVGLTGSRDIATTSFIFGALIIQILKLIFISLAFRPIYRRLMLEARTYKHIRASSFIYLLRVKKYTKASLAMLRIYIFETLWLFTIVGFPIKHYAYAMAPYIIAENPTLTGKEAINLSQQMMKGHKWELFVLNMSYVGWNILGYLTMGILDTMFTTPYLEATMSEYFVRLRADAIENIPGAKEVFCDEYLYRKATESEIKRAYADVIAMAEEPEVVLRKYGKIRNFFADVFGVVLWYDDKENEYRECLARKNKIDSYKYVVAEEAYPSKLSPIPLMEQKIHLEHLHYARHYSVCSLILMFFIFCVVGWLWEVSIHIVEDGVFVNRGVLHGPWLPIYGSGGLMIITLLNKFRKNPMVEFISSIVLCGIVEYFTSVFLEIRHDGQKWWDYSGYFLNLNGRICAEGLLVFGLAGFAGVYFLAPLIDNGLRRFPLRKILPICVILLLVFTIDNVYSSKHPNAGKGITDYTTAAQGAAQGDGSFVLHMGTVLLCRSFM